MKRLPIVLCLMIIGIVLFNSHVHAAYIYNVDSFKQDNTVGGTNTFVDNFDDGTAPPIGPDGVSADYNVDSSGPLSESGGVLVLDSVNGGDAPGGWIGVGLRNSDYYFTDGNGGSLEAVFNYASSGLQNGSAFGIDMFDMASDGDDDEATVGVLTDTNGDVYYGWGDEGSDIGLELFTGGAFTQIKLTLDISGNNWVSGSWDFLNSGSSVFQYTLTDFTRLEFGAPGPYTGRIGADEPAIAVEPVPEPTTVALLGIGLVGLAGAEVRRRRKKAVDKS